MIDQFSKQRFENALPKDRQNNPLWVWVGVVKGEHTYIVPITDKGIHIEIRSSVGGNGIAKESGADSIRLTLLETGASRVLINKYARPLVKGRYITRVNGWEMRLIEALRDLYHLGNQLEQHCGQSMFLTATKGKKLYAKCGQCGAAKWEIYARG